MKFELLLLLLDDKLIYRAKSRSASSLGVESSMAVFKNYGYWGDNQGNLIGAAGLCYIDWVNRTSDFSIYIGWKGLYIDGDFAPDAARTIIKYAFEELGLNRLWSEIYNFDHSKVRFFNELGFKLDGKHRQTHWSENAWHDSLFFSLLASDPQPCN